MQKSIIDISKERRNLVIGLVVAILAVDGVVFLTAGMDIGIIIGDLSRIGTIGSAAVLSLVVVKRQKVSGLFGRAYASLAAALILWLVAESVWGFYEVGLGIESPFPSIADLFWMVAYAPLGYHVFSTFKFFGRGVKIFTAVAVLVGAAIFLYLYVQAILDVSDLDGPDTLLPLGISIAYPVLDTIIIIPAILVITNAGRGQLTSIPWIFLAYILLVVADSLLGITAVTNFTGEGFHITMTYNASYLCFAAGLIWYNRLFIMKEPKPIRE